MDSASFIVEYLYFDKPILFTLRDDSVKSRFNSFGNKVFDYLYTSSGKPTTIEFIDKTIPCAAGMDLVAVSPSL